MIRHCYSCGAVCQDRHYLCAGCWASLSPVTRRRLRLKDSRAGVRLIELLRQAHHETPLREIKVTP